LLKLQQKGDHGRKIELQSQLTTQQLRRITVMWRDRLLSSTVIEGKQILYLSYSK
jgi:hypothetical protein